MAYSEVRTELRDAVGNLAADGGDLGETAEMAGALAELLRPYAGEGFHCLMAPLPPTPPTSYPGVDGIARAWQDFSGSFRSVSATLDEIRESGSALTLLVTQRVVTAHGGVTMTQPSALVIVFEGDKVANVQFHLDQDAALRAGGL